MHYIVISIKHLLLFKLHFKDKALEVHAFAFIRNIVKVDEGDSVRFNFKTQ